MKKLFWILIAITVIAFVGCGSSNKTPGDAAKEYYSYAKAGDWDKFADGFKADNPYQKEMIISLLKEKGAPEIEEQGGIKEYSVISETINEDNPDKVVVKMKVVYGNGTEDEEDIKLTKSDGKWLMTMDK